MGWQRDGPYADDLAALFEKLDLKDAVMVGHSTGGGEVARYLGRHGTKRVSKVVLISAVPPVMVKSAKNPGGLPIEAFDEIRAGMYDQSLIPGDNARIGPTSFEVWLQSNPQK